MNESNRERVKAFLKFRNKANEKSTEDMVSDFLSKGGEVKHGKTKPMDDSLRYRSRVRGPRDDVMKSRGGIGASTLTVGMKDPNSRALKRYHDDAFGKKGVLKTAQQVEEVEVDLGESFSMDKKAEDGTYTFHRKKEFGAIQTHRGAAKKLSRKLALGGVKHKVLGSGDETSGHWVRVALGEEWEDVDEGRTYRGGNFRTRAAKEFLKGTERKRQSIRDMKHRIVDTYGRSFDAYARPKAVGEEVERLDEVGDTERGRRTLQSYADKRKAEGKALGFGGQPKDEAEAKVATKHMHGILRAHDRIKDNTPVEKPRLHDLSHMDDGEVYDHTQTSGKVKDGDALKLSGNRAAIMFRAWPTMVHGDSKHLHAFEKKAPPRYKKSIELAKASVKAVGEEVEQIDELSKRLLNRYRTKAEDETYGRQVRMPGKSKKDRSTGIKAASDKIGFRAKVVAREEVEEVSEAWTNYGPSNGKKRKETGEIYHIVTDNDTLDRHKIDRNENGKYGETSLFLNKGARFHVYQSGNDKARGKKELSLRALVGSKHTAADVESLKRHINWRNQNEEVEDVSELDRNMGKILDRYISRTEFDPDRKKGRALALKKRWGDAKYGLPEPKVKGVDR